MKGYNRRYMLLSLGSSIAPAFLLAFFFGPLPFVLYVAAYLVVFDNSLWLKRALDKFARGKEKKA